MYTCTYSLYNVHLNCGSLKITIYLLIHSFIHLFSIILKKNSVQFRCLYITTIHKNARCISRESIRVVLFSIGVVAKNMETIVLQFSGRNMSIQWSK